MTPNDDPIEQLADSTDDAFCIGVNDLGERLEYSPKDVPHAIVIGGTGSGKSGSLTRSGAVSPR